MNRSYIFFDGQLESRLLRVTVGDFMEQSVLQSPFVNTECRANFAVCFLRKVRHHPLMWGFDLLFHVTWELSGAVASLVLPKG